MRDIKKECIEKIKFKTFDVVEYPEQLSTSYSINPSDQIAIPPVDHEQQNKLRKKADYIFHTMFNGDYQLLYQNCDLNDSTFRKFISGNRHISKTNLVKFIIGSAQDQESAEEMLSMNGTPFDYDNRFDYILACAIRDGDTIDMLHDELIKYRCKGLDLPGDKG